MSNKKVPTSSSPAHKVCYNFSTMKLRFSPEWILRIGLGTVYAYSGYGILSQPENWAGYAPNWFVNIASSVMPFMTFMRFQGAVEIIFAVGFLGWFFWRKTVRVIAGLAALEMLAIVVFTGVNLVTFRDIGLFAALLALWLSLKEKIS